jgi:hypothetical protein
VTDSQLFAFDGNGGTITFQPQNQKGSCLVVKDNSLDIAPCDDADSNQTFIIDGGISGTPSSETTITTTSSATDTVATTTTTTGRGRNRNRTSTATSSSSSSIESESPGQSITTCSPITRTVTETVIATPDNSATETPETTETTSSTATTASGGNGGQGIPTFNPTEPVPVSRAGGTLNPTAAAEAHERDETATRVFSNVEIRAPNGKCLFVDPTAGDFRQNLIPISLVECSGSPNEKWDVISQGKHNDANPNRPAVLVVSALVC